MMLSTLLMPDLGVQHRSVIMHCADRSDYPRVMQ